VASFVNPHDICEWARIASGLPEKLPHGDLATPPPAAECPPLPANFGIPAREPEVIRRLKVLAPKTYPTANWTADAWRQYLWVYYRLTERVDSQIGEILRTLRETGQDQNTLIVFSSDHGDGAAAHQWNQKLLFYEETARVPFIVRPPGLVRAGRRDRVNLVNMNLDFFPTALDYAGIPVPADLTGRSVRPLVEGAPHAAGHAFTVSQSDLAPNATESGGVFGRMLRSARFKNIRYSEGAHAEQLFDLERDPGEMNNLAGDPATKPAVEEHRQLLAAWLARHRDPFPLKVPARSRA
jgi:choline-sulfatase